MDLRWRSRCSSSEMICPKSKMTMLANPELEPNPFDSQSTAGP